MDQKRSIQRREFLAQASVAGTLSVAGIAAFNEMKPLTHGGDLEFGSEYQAFEKLVGERFKVDCGATGGTTTVVLDDVKLRTRKQNEHRPNHVRQQSCSLLFASMSGVKLENAIHRFTHPQTGSFQLCINRTRRDCHPNWTHYDAVIG